MDTLSVIWRQACKIKNDADNLAKSADGNDKNGLNNITYSASVIVYEAACGERKQEFKVCKNIIHELGKLQTTLWTFIKNCSNSFIQQIANKLYYACSNFKRLVKKKLKEIAQYLKPNTNTATTIIANDYCPCTALPCQI